MSTLAELPSLVTKMYAPSIPNDERRRCIAVVNDMEERLSSVDLLNCASALFGGEFPYTTRAYGLVMLTRAVDSGKLAADAAPRLEILQTLLCTGDTLPRILQRSCRRFLIACLFRGNFSFGWPDFFPTVLQAPPPGTGVGCMQQRLMLLLECCESMCSPPYAHLSAAEIRTIASAFRSLSPTVLLFAVQQAEQIRTHLIQCAQSQKQELPPAAYDELFCLLDICLETIVLCMGAFSSKRQSEDFGLCNLVTQLVDGQLCLRCFSGGGAANRCLLTPLMNIAIGMIGTSGDPPQMFAPLICVLINLTPAVIANQQWSVLNSILDLITATLSFPLIETALCAAQNALCILHVPSVLFAAPAMEVLWEVLKKYHAQINSITPEEVFVVVCNFCEKNILNPWLTTPNAAMSELEILGARLSADQLSTLQTFDLAFAELRGTARKLLVLLGTFYAEATARMCIQLVQSLSLERISTDPLTHFGHVTQRSRQFTSWERASFCCEACAPAWVPIVATSNVPLLQEYVSSIFLFRSVTDATLAPIFLNFLSTCWVVPLSSETQELNLRIWEESLNVLFTFMTRSIPGTIDQFSDDVDLLALRKRACTMLIRACVEYAPCILPLADQVVTQTRAVILSSMLTSTEKAYLYEALAALSNCMPESEARNAFLSKIVDPMLAELNRIIAQNQERSGDGANTLFTPQCLSRILCGEQATDRSERSLLRDAIAVLSSIFRRCNPSPFLSIIATQLSSLFGNILLAIHILDATPTLLPPKYYPILLQDPVEKEQLEGVTVRAPRSAVSREDIGVSRARSALQLIRFSLYQAIGSIGRFISVDEISSGIRDLVSYESMSTIPLFQMRVFNKHCLFPLCGCFPAAVPLVLDANRYVIDCRHSKLSGAKVEVPNTASSSFSGEVIDVSEERVFSFFLRELLHFIRETVLGGVQFNGVSSNNNSSATTCTVPLENRVALFNLLPSLTLRTGGVEVRSTAMVALTLGTTWSSEEVSIRVFALLLRAARYVSGLSEKDRDSIYGMLADQFVKKFPFFVTSLQQIPNYDEEGLGLSNEDVQKLESVLMIVPRIDQKRKRFQEFLSAALR